MQENNTVFVTIDFSDSKAIIEKALNEEQVTKAREESVKVLDAQDEIKKNTKAVGGNLVFDSGEALVINIPFDKELIEAFSEVYSHYMGNYPNIGVGNTPIESYESLDAVEEGDNGNIVTSSNDIQENLKANRLFYKQSAGSKDLGIARTIKRALLELNIITSDKKIYDIFLTLVERYGLNSMDELQSFFYKPLENLKEDIRDIYRAQKTAGIKFANEKKQTFPGQTNLPKTRKQRSPHKYMNWVTTEEYNDGKVDYRKTDIQYNSGNQTRDSQEMSMGGEPGNAVYIP